MDTKQILTRYVLPAVLYVALGAGVLGTCHVVSQREEARAKAHYENVVRPVEKSVDNMLYEDRMKESLQRDKRAGELDEASWLEAGLEGFDFRSK